MSGVTLPVQCSWARNIVFLCVLSFNQSKSDSELPILFSGQIINRSFWKPNPWKIVPNWAKVWRHLTHSSADSPRFCVSCLIRFGDFSVSESYFRAQGSLLRLEIQCLRPRIPWDLALTQDSDGLCPHNQSCILTLWSLSTLLSLSLSFKALLPPPPFSLRVSASSQKWARAFYQRQEDLLASSSFCFQSC